MDNAWLLFQSYNKRSSSATYRGVIMSLSRALQQRSALSALCRSLSFAAGGPLNLSAHGFASLPDPITDETPPQNSKNGKVNLAWVMIWFLYLFGGHLATSPCATGQFSKCSICAMQVLHPDLLNENLLRAEYAVRGELYLRGEELRKQGKEIIFTNGEASLSDSVTSDTKSMNRLCSS